MPEVDDQPDVITREDVTRMTTEIMTTIGHVDIPTGLGLLCNLVGQLAAAKAKNVPSAVRHEIQVITDNIQRSAVAKMLHDDEVRRQADEET